MSFHFRPSLAEQLTKAPTIALAGESGSGKTESALRIARGYCGDGVKFAVIDTEEKRALYKRNRYQPWDWIDFQPPFSPQRYIEVLEAAKDYPAVVLDSGSHEWQGEGSCQDIQAEALDRMAKGDPGKLAQLSAPAWRGAKLEHKKLMHRIIRYPTLLIICLRAEPKIKFVKDERGKTQIVDAGYQPICEKMFMYEMLVGALMHSDNPGVPVHLKKLERELEPVFIAGKQIDESTGRRLREWSSGQPKAEAREPVSASPGPVVTAAARPPASSAPDDDDPFLSEDNPPVVDTETGEVTTRHRNYPFSVPGRPVMNCPTIELWMVQWNEMAAKIAASQKLSPATKEAKIRALQKENEEFIRSMSGRFVAEMRADVAARVAKINEPPQEEPKREPDDKSTATVSG